MDDLQLTVLQHYAHCEHVYMLRIEHARTCAVIDHELCTHLPTITGFLAGAAGSGWVEAYSCVNCFDLLPRSTSVCSKISCFSTSVTSTFWANGDLLANSMLIQQVPMSTLQRRSWRDLLSSVVEYLNRCGGFSRSDHGMKRCKRRHEHCDADILLATTMQNLTRMVMWKHVLQAHLRTCSNVTPCMLDRSPPHAFCDRMTKTSELASCHSASSAH